MKNTIGGAKCKLSHKKIKEKGTNVYIFGSNKIDYTSKVIGGLEFGCDHMNLY